MVLIDSNVGMMFGYIDLGQLQKGLCQLRLFTLLSSPVKPEPEPEPKVFRFFHKTWLAEFLIQKRWRKVWECCCLLNLISGYKDISIRKLVFVARVQFIFMPGSSNKSCKDWWFLSFKDLQKPWLNVLVLYSWIH